MNELETPRLKLRELTSNDAPFILELLNDAEFLRYIGDRHVRDLEEARRYIEGQCQSYRELGFGLLLVQTRNGAPAGLCGLVQRNYFADPDLGFAFLPAYRSQGLCSEAGRAVLLDAFEAQRCNRILAIVQPDNAASIGVLRKLGFCLERHFKTSAASEPLMVMICYRRDSRQCETPSGE